MKNVLLVDDDKICNYLNTKVIERLGIIAGVHTATNGDEAISLINDYFQGSRMIPDVILLDLNMPVMDGFSFVEAFRRLNIPGIDQVKIIIVTSSEDPHDLARAKELGITQYLVKPLNVDDLKKALTLN